MTGPPAETPPFEQEVTDLLRALLPTDQREMVRAVLAPRVIRAIRAAGSVAIRTAEDGARARAAALAALRGPP